MLLVATPDFIPRPFECWKCLCGDTRRPVTQPWSLKVVELSVWRVGVRGHQGWVGHSVNDRKIPHTFSARSTLKHWPLLSPVATQPLQAFATLQKLDTRRSVELHEPNYTERWRPAQACAIRATIRPSDRSLLLSRSHLKTLIPANSITAWMWTNWHQRLDTHCRRDIISRGLKKSRNRLKLCPSRYESVWSNVSSFMLADDEHVDGKVWAESFHSHEIKSKQKKKMFNNAGFSLNVAGVWLKLFLVLCRLSLKDWKLIKSSARNHN